MTTEIMTSVYPKYTDMIKKGYKQIEYRNSVPKQLKHNDIVWIYESKKYGGCGKAIRKAIVDCVIPMEDMEQRYYKYIFRNTNKQHMQAYLNEIGAGRNYALLLKVFIPCCLDLTDFVYAGSDKHISQAPQNFYYVKGGLTQ